MTELTGKPGFAPPQGGHAQLRRRAMALELIATGALTISLIIAVTAVSVGQRSLARSHAPDPPSAQPLLLRQ